MTAMKPLPLVTASAALLGLFWLAAGPAPTPAQGIKGNPEIVLLRQQVQTLQREVRERDQKITQLQTQLKEKGDSVNKLKGNLKKEDADDAKRDKELAAVRKELDGMKQAGVVRTMLLKLKG